MPRPIPGEPRSFDPVSTNPLDPYDDGPPTGALHSETRALRALRPEPDLGHGPKTRAANREKIKGSKLHNPR